MLTITNQRFQIKHKKVKIMNIVKRNSVHGFPVMDQFFKDILGGTQAAHTLVPPVNVKEKPKQLSVLSLSLRDLKKKASVLRLITTCLPSRLKRKQNQPKKKKVNLQGGNSAAHRSRGRSGFLRM